MAFEAKLDADKPLMIKNAIHARKTMVRRAKTMKYELTRKKRSRGNYFFSFHVTIIHTVDKIFGYF